MELKPGYKQTEAGVIPDDWSSNYLSTLCVPNGLVRGPFGGSLKKEFFVEEGYKVYEQRNAIYQSIEVGSYYIDQNKYTELKRFDVVPGDFIVSCSGTIGRIFQIPKDAKAGVINQALLKIKLNTNIVSSDYFYQVFVWNDFQQKIVDSTQGGAMQNLVGMDVFKSTPLALPPLAEQRAIAAALSDTDALLCSLDRLLAKKHDIKQAVMQQLLTGKQRLPGFSGEWEVKRLGDFGRCLRGVSYKGDSDLSSHDTETTYRLLRSNNVQGATVNTKDVQYVNRERVSEQQKMQFDDVLICMANGSKDLVGKAGIFNISDGYVYTFGAFMGCFRTQPEVANPAFMFFMFQTDKYRDYINNLLAGSSINNLKPSSIESLEFPLPQPPEQAAISAVLSDMDAEIDALQQRRDKTRAVKQGMMQELLTGRTRLV